MTAEMWHEVIDTNLTSGLHAASKAGLIGLMRVIAAE